MHYYNTAYSKNGKKTIVAKVLCSLLYQGDMTNININNTPFIDIKITILEFKHAGCTIVFFWHKTLPCSNKKLNLLQLHYSPLILRSRGVGSAGIME
jgi:hypothetical protein